LLSYARVIEAASAAKPAEGDIVLVRSPPGFKDRSLSATVFRIEEDYCLLAAGETDSVRVGDKFLVRRQDVNDASRWHDVAELTVKTTKVDYAGANIRLMNPNDHALELWDVAERTGPCLKSFRTIGIVEHVQLEYRWVAVSIDVRSEVEPGTMVRCVSADNRPCAAGLIVCRMRDQVIVYIPINWGKMKDLLHARLEIIEKYRPPTTVPVTTRVAPATTRTAPGDKGGSKYP
jgi:hypothetical protein